MTEFIYFALGTVVAVLLTPAFWELVQRLRRRISWRRFFKTLTSEQILDSLAKQDSRPDIIIGVNDGIVPAAILATNLRVKKLYYCDAEPQFEPDGRRKKPCFRELRLDLGGKRVLIVDDQALTGESLNSVYDYVKTLPGADKASVRRLAVFTYDTPVRKVAVDINSPGTMKGTLKLMPWSFTSEHEQLLRPRNH